MTTLSVTIETKVENYNMFVDFTHSLYLAALGAKVNQLALETWSMLAALPDPSITAQDMATLSVISEMALSATQEAMKEPTGISPQEINARLNNGFEMAMTALTTVTEIHDRHKVSSVTVRYLARLMQVYVENPETADA